MKTHFAPLERTTEENFSHGCNMVSESSIAATLLATVGGLFLIVNSNREIVAMNKKLLEYHKISDHKGFRGLRLGQFINCTQLKNGPHECGCTKACASCGAAIAIVTALASDKTVGKLCVLNIDKEGSTEDIIFNVSASPIKIENITFILVFFTDVTEVQNHKVLEHTFHPFSQARKCLL